MHNLIARLILDNTEILTPQWSVEHRQVHGLHPFGSKPLIQDDKLPQFLRLTYYDDDMVERWKHVAIVDVEYVGEQLQLKRMELVSLDDQNTLEREYQYYKEASFTVRVPYECADGVFV